MIGEHNVEKIPDGPRDIVSLGADIAPAGPLMLVADNDGGRGAA